MRLATCIWPFALLSKCRATGALHGGLNFSTLSLPATHHLGWVGGRSQGQQAPAPGAPWGEVVRNWPRGT